MRLRPRHKAYPRLSAVFCVLLLVQPALGKTRAERRELRAAEAKRRALAAPPLTVVVLGDGQPLHVSLKNEDLGSDARTTRCDTPCVVTVTTGRYRIGVERTEHTLGGSRIVTLDGTAHTVTVTPRDPAARTVGLAVGVLGTAMIAGGFALGAASEPAPRGLCSEHTPCPVDDGLAWVGVSLILAGLALTPIGWTLFGKSFGPSVAVTSPPAKLSVAGTLGVVPVRGGAAISGTLTF